MKIIMLAAVTIDGKLARNSAHFVDWTSREDKKMFFAATYVVDTAAKPHRITMVSTTPKAGETAKGVVEATGDTLELGALARRIEERQRLDRHSHPLALVVHRELLRPKEHLLCDADLDTTAPPSEDVEDIGKDLVR